MPYNVFVIFLASSQNIRPLKVCLCKIRSCLKIEIQLKVIARAEQILGRQDLSGMHLKDKEEEDTLFVFFQPHHSKSFLNHKMSEDSTTLKFSSQNWDGNFFKLFCQNMTREMFGVRSNRGEFCQTKVLGVNNYWSV